MNTESFLKKEYPYEAWADRKPKVMRGTALTSDRYWKGRYDHQNALLVTQTYKCEDPYAITEMEDIAVAQAVNRLGLLDRLISVDIFETGMKNCFNVSKVLIDSVDNESTHKADSLEEFYKSN